MSLMIDKDVRIFLDRLGVGDLDFSELSLQNLTRLVCAFQETLPFQNVSIMSMAVEERHVPSLEEVVAKGLALEGGVCYDLNVFMCVLLRALGYQADVLDGSYSAAPFRHTHVVVLVHNIRYPGDRHIVDIGTGSPFLEPVPVNELPKTYLWAGLEIRYTCEGDHAYRCHRTGDLLNEPISEQVMRGEWRQVFDFSLQPVDYDFFRPNMKHIYVEEENNFFLKDVRACRYPRVNNCNSKECGDSCQHDSNSNTEKTKLGTATDKSFKDSHHLLAIRNNVIMQGPMNNLKEEDIRVDELATQLRHHFPNLPSSKIHAAIDRYKLFIL